MGYKILGIFNYKSQAFALGSIIYRVYFYIYGLVFFYLCFCHYIFYIYFSNKFLLFYLILCYFLLWFIFVKFKSKHISFAHYYYKNDQIIRLIPFYILFFFLVFVFIFNFTYFIFGCLFVDLGSLFFVMTSKYIQMATFWTMPAINLYLEYYYEYDYVTFRYLNVSGKFRMVGPNNRTFYLAAENDRAPYITRSAVHPRWHNQFWPFLDRQFYLEFFVTQYARRRRMLGFFISSPNYYAYFRSWKEPLLDTRSHLGVKLQAFEFLFSRILYAYLNS